MSGPVHHFLPLADVVFGVGCSFTKHGMATGIPAGKTIIHATNDERDLNKNYQADYPILGDAKLVLRQLVDAVKDAAGRQPRDAGLWKRRALVGKVGIDRRHVGEHVGVAERDRLGIDGGARGELDERQVRGLILELIGQFRRVQPQIRARRGT